MPNKITPLSDILTEPISSVEERSFTTLEGLLRANQNQVVIFGCGGLGQRAMKKFRELNLEPLAFCDNSESLWGTRIDGVLVQSVAQAATLYGKTSLFFIAVWNPHHWYEETAQKLRAAGVLSISSYLPMYWRFPDSFLQTYLLNDLPQNVYVAKDDVLSAEKIWADETSLLIYRANILWRILGDPSQMPPRPPENTYFPSELFNLTSNECLLDCGAYDGDTVRQVLHCTGSAFGAIYCLEGDPVSFEKLQTFVASLSPEIKEKIYPIHGAVSDTRTVVRFTASGGTGSRMDDSDGFEVQCYPLDSLPIVMPVTMIKMDIEGAEYDALVGSINTIVRDQPILAICVYHLQRDIWRIPLLARKLLPHHKLYLRAYEGDGFQTVMYAVPPHRVLCLSDKALH